MHVSVLLSILPTHSFSTVFISSLYSHHIQKYICIYIIIYNNNIIIINNNNTATTATIKFLNNY